MWGIICIFVSGNDWYRFQQFRPDRRHQCDERPTRGLAGLDSLEQPWVGGRLEKSDSYKQLPV